MERKVLGRGLSALIPEKPKSEEQKSFGTIKVSDIITGSFQPREKFDVDQLNALAESIKYKGVIQPLVVRLKGDRYELVAGERRLRACMLLGFEEVPVIVKNELGDSDALQVSLIENIQRENLNPIEEAKAYSDLSEKYGMSQEQIGQAVGRDRASVANTLRLLKLPEIIQNAVRESIITAGHARTILSLGDSKGQINFFESILKKGLSVREAEAVSRRKKLSPNTVKTKKDPHLFAMEEELQRALGTKVKIMHGKKRGKIVIDYYSHDDLTRVASKLGYNADSL